MGILDDIKALRIQGSINIALALLDYMEEFGERNGYGREFVEEAERVWRIRPTAVIPYNAMKALIERPGRKRIEEVRESIRKIDDKVNESFYSLVRDREKLAVMLHCHSTEVVNALIYCMENGMEVGAYVTETRPKMQGHITARELADAGADVRLVVDDSMAFFMDRVDMSVVGSDSLRKEGVVNKIGTLETAIVSRHFGREMVVLSSRWKVDRREEFEIEFRDPAELGFDGHERVEVLNPAFDITPWRLVGFLVVEDNAIPGPDWGDVDVLEAGI